MCVHAHVYIHLCMCTCAYGSMCVCMHVYGGQRLPFDIFPNHLFTLFYVFEYLFLFMYICMCRAIYGCLRRPEEGFGNHGSRITGSCKVLDVGAEI